MCQLSMKLSDTFDQNLPCTLDQIREKPIPIKTLSELDLESKGQGHSKNQKTMPQGAINMSSTKKMSRDSPNYWCLTDLSNMSSVKQYVDPHPMGRRHKNYEVNF